MEKKEVWLMSKRRDRRRKKKAGVGGRGTPGGFVEGLELEYNNF